MFHLRNLFKRTEVRRALDPETNKPYPRMITPNTLKILSAVVKMAALASEFIGPFQNSKWGFIVFAIVSIIKDGGTAAIRVVEGKK